MEADRELTFLTAPWPGSWEISWPKCLISTIKRARRALGWNSKQTRYCALTSEINKEKRMMVVLRSYWQRWSRTILDTWTVFAYSFQAQEHIEKLKVGVQDSNTSPYCLNSIPDPNTSPHCLSSANIISTSTCSCCFPRISKCRRDLEN